MHFEAISCVRVYCDSNIYLVIQISGKSRIDNELSMPPGLLNSYHRNPLIISLNFHYKFVTTDLRALNMNIDLFFTMNFGRFIDSVCKKRIIQIVQIWSIMMWNIIICCVLRTNVTFDGRPEKNTIDVCSNYRAKTN